VNATRLRRHSVTPLWVLLALGLGLGLLGSCEARIGTRESCWVGRVRDGDSLTLNCGRPGNSALEVRLWGIDAPELTQRPWGEAARHRLQKLAAGRVGLVRVDRDSYGRVVGRLYRNRQDVGLQLVREGYATVYTKYNHDPEYYRARAAARQAGLGIWSRPGLQQTPWKWRAEHPRE
jgi:micrococcal nuclease